MWRKPVICGGESLLLNLGEALACGCTYTVARRIEATWMRAGEARLANPRGIGESRIGYVTRSRSHAEARSITVTTTITMIITAAVCA